MGSIAVQAWKQQGLSSFAHPGKAGPLLNSAQAMIPSGSTTPLLHGIFHFVGFQLWIHERTHHGFIYLFGSIIILDVHLY